MQRQQEQNSIRSTQIRVAQSLLAVASLAEYIGQNYSLGAIHECSLHMSGVNDVYRVLAQSGTYFFKVYRYQWRSYENVRFETDLLTHLQRHGVAVALPVVDHRNESVLRLGAPEGERPAVLYQAAPGQQPTWPFYRDAHQARLLGTALARLHKAAMGFTSSFVRDRLDATALIDASLDAIMPFADRVPDGLARVHRAVESLRGQLLVFLPQGLTSSVCHGDYHCGNVFLTADDQVTLFDFDACGDGYVAFDLARWRSLTSDPAGDTSWTAFLDGYVQTLPLTKADQEALPLFVKLRLLQWAQIKLRFVARGQWDGWDIGFFLEDLLHQIAPNLADSSL